MDPSSVPHAERTAAARAAARRNRIDEAAAAAGAHGEEVAIPDEPAVEPTPAERRRLRQRDAARTPRW